MPRYNNQPERQLGAVTEISNASITSQAKALAVFEAGLKKTVAAMRSRVIEILSAGELTPKVAAQAQSLLQLQAELQKQLNSEGYPELVKELTGSFDQSVENAIATVKALKLPDERLAPLDRNALKQLKNIDYDYLSGLGTEAVKSVGQAVIQNALLGTARAPLIDKIAATLDLKLKNYAATYADTALVVYDRTVSMKIWQTAGIKNFTYRGPKDIKNRPFCLAKIDKLYTLKDIHAMDAELKQLSKTPLLPALRYGGGWNCRHVWMPWPADMPAPKAADTGASGKMPQAVAMAATREALGFEKRPGTYVPPAPPEAPKPPAPKPWALKSANPGLGGAHAKEIWTDPAGNDWLFKPVDASKKIIPYAEEAAANVARLVNPQTAVEVHTMTLGGKFGSAQKFVPDLAKKIDFTNGGQNKPVPMESLSAFEIQQIQREHVLDWLISNHDGHPGQFLRTKSGAIYGIDKAQAYKHIGNDQLSVDYHPNKSFGEQEPLYNTLGKAIKAGKVQFNPADSLPAIEAAEKISDADYLKAVEGYAANHPGGPAAAAKFKAAAIARKNSLRSDFETYYRKLTSDPHFSFDPAKMAAAKKAHADAIAAANQKAADALALQKANEEAAAKVKAAAEKAEYEAKLAAAEKLAAEAKAAAEANAAPVPPGMAAVYKNQYSEWSAKWDGGKGGYVWVKPDGTLATDTVTSPDQMKKSVVGTTKASQNKAMVAQTPIMPAAPKPPKAATKKAADEPPPGLAAKYQNKNTNWTATWDSVKGGYVWSKADGTLTHLVTPGADFKSTFLNDADTVALTPTSAQKKQPHLAPTEQEKHEQKEIVKKHEALGYNGLSEYEQGLLDGLPLSELKSLQKEIDEDEKSDVTEAASSAQKAADVAAAAAQTAAATVLNVEDEAEAKRLARNAYTRAQRAKKKGVVLDDPAPEEEAETGDLAHLGERNLAHVATAKANGWQGKTLAIDKDQIEDQNVLVWQEKTKAGDRTMLRMKLRLEAQDDFLRGLGLDPGVAKNDDDDDDSNKASSKSDVELVPIPHAPVSKQIFSNLVNGVGNVSLSTPDDSKAWAFGWGGQMSIEQVKQLKKEFTDWTSAVTKERARLKKLEDQAANKGAIQTGEKQFTVKQTGARVDSKEIKNGSIIVAEEQVSLSSVYTGAGAGLQQYNVTWKDGVRVRYIPYSEGKGDTNTKSFTFHGTLEVMVPGAVDPKQVEHALKRLSETGLNTKAATKTDEELLYLQKATYVANAHTSAEWKELVAKHKTENTSDAARVVEMRAYWSRRLGVPDVTKLPEYKPEGQYEQRWDKHGEQAGNRHQYRFDLTEQQLNEQLGEYRLVHDIKFGNASAKLNEFFDVALPNNASMVSTTEKLRTGITRKGAGSATADIKSGGGSYVFTRIQKAANTKSQIYFKVRNLRRMDAISYDGDKYGRVTGDTVSTERGSTISEFKKYSLHSGNETILKNTLSLLHEIDHVKTLDEHERQEVLAVFRKHGITKFPDGRPIEKVIQAGSRY